MNWSTNITIENTINNVWDIINLNNTENRDLLYPKIKGYSLNFHINDTFNNKAVHEVNDKQVMIKEIKDTDFLKYIHYTFEDNNKNIYDVKISLRAEGNNSDLQYDGNVIVAKGFKNKLLTGAKKLNDDAIEYCLVVQELSE